MKLYTLENVCLTREHIKSKRVTIDVGAFTWQTQNY